jgi:outer membrane protein assembly factor BamB
MTKATSVHVGIAVTALVLAVALQAAADEWPQWRGPSRDGVWRETGLLDRFPGAELAPRWRTPISGGYSGPTVANGRVYVTDRVTEPTQQERVLCFAWDTGRQLWAHAYPCDYGKVSYTTGPRAAVTISEGRAYSLGTMGHLLCLDAGTGEVLWRKDPQTDYNARVPPWGIAASPLVEGDLVIVQVGGENGACLVAFDKVTGQERWRALGDRASYSSPILIDQAGQRALVCLTGERVAALNPGTGELLWDCPFPPTKMVIAVATPVVHNQWLFVSSFYDGSLMLKLAPDRLAAEEVWRRRGESETKTDALHCMISTPIVDDTHVYGFDSYGAFRCLDAATGDRVWETFQPVPENRWATAHMVRNGGKVWLFNEKGELILATLSPEGYHGISRAKLIKPTLGQLPGEKRGGVCWAHPAFAYKHVFARNDEELVCASLEAG